MTLILDYGVGNLFSLRSSLSAIGEEASVSSNPREIPLADRLILPGVGAFADAAQKLDACGLAEPLKKAALGGKPLLGICLGMQLLFEESLEFGRHKGLGLVKGTVRPIADVIPKSYKIPHIGWNGLHLTDPSCPLWKYTKEGDCFYFVHSFYGAECDAVCATTEYGAELTAAVAAGCIYGTQFHPEKSGDAGLALLRAFCEVRK